jgi:hypothetical protein
VARELGADEVLHEAQPGLSYARNLGWRAARAPLVAFLDDDAEAAPDWLESALAVLEAEHAIAVGGPILPSYDVPPPRWFRDDYELRSWGDADRLLLPGESLSGSNVVIARSALEALGGFDERLGMRGDRVAVGEESALFDRLWLCGDARVAYSPRLVVRHRVPPAKTTVAYQLRRAAAAGDAWAVRQELEGAARARRAAADAAAATGLMVRALTRLRRPLQRWAVEELAAAAGRLGSLRGTLR